MEFANRWERLVSLAPVAVKSAAAVKALAALLHHQLLSGLKRVPETNVLGWESN
jgi:hypothetical protein